MKITGKLEVFKNQRGYLTGILKAFDKDKNLIGKIFIDVQGLDISAGNEFKIRVNHDWGKNFGYYSLTIVGLSVSGYDNVVAETPFKGSAILEFDWNGWTEENIVLTFYLQ